MNRFAKTDLEGCVKELAERVRRDLEGMTPLERNEYFLCRSIEHLIRANAFDAPTAVVDIAHYRQRRQLDHLKAHPASRHPRVISQE